MSEQTAKPGIGVNLNVEAYARAPKLFAQATLLAHSEREVGILFGTNPPIVAQGEVSPFLTDVVVFFTLDHFREFASMVSERLVQLEAARGGSEK